MLITTLAALNLSNSVADLDANLKRLDKRFIGVYGYSCSAPVLVMQTGTWCSQWRMDYVAWLVQVILSRVTRTRF